MLNGLLLFVTLCHAPALAQAYDDLRYTPVVQAVERATPAVVTIRVEVETASPFLMFGGTQRTQSEGSGVIIDADGVVLTNAHVVDGARRITVHLQSGAVHEADLVAADPALDLAVLRLQGARGLPVIRLGDSSALLLGEPAIAIGNPYGLGLTVSTGVVSSIARDVPVGDGPVQTYIQTDAAINPGNSGGALVNIHGELIGINTFIHQAAEGVGFAIPVNRVRKIAADLLAFGEVQIPWLGLAVADAAVGRRTRRSVVLVRQVTPGGPAAAAGVRVGDVLVDVDGHALATRSDLNARLAERAPGDAVTLTVQRESAAVDVTVRTRRAPSDLGAGALQSWGVTVVPYRGGLQVATASREGLWTSARLAHGDVIVAVDGLRTRSEAELVAALGGARARHRASVFVTVVREPYRGTVEVGL